MLDYKLKIKDNSQLIRVYPHSYKKLLKTRPFLLVFKLFHRVFHIFKNICAVS